MKSIPFPMYFGGLVEYHPKDEKTNERDLTKVNRMIKLIEVDDNNSCNIAMYNLADNIPLDFVQKLQAFQPVTAFIELNLTNAKYQKLTDLKPRKDD